MFESHSTSDVSLLLMYILGSNFGGTKTLVLVAHGGDPDEFLAAGLGLASLAVVGIEE